MEARGFRDAYETAIKVKVVVLGISPDSSEKLNRFSEANHLPFDLLSDPEHRVARLYDVRRRFGLGLSRVTYVIDGARRVKGAFHREVRIGRHVADVLTALHRE